MSMPTRTLSLILFGGFVAVCLSIGLVVSLVPSWLSAEALELVVGWVFVAVGVVLGMLILEVVDDEGFASGAIAFFWCFGIAMSQVHPTIHWVTVVALCLAVLPPLLAAKDGRELAVNLWLMSGVGLTLVQIFDAEIGRPLLTLSSIGWYLDVRITLTLAFLAYAVIRGAATAFSSTAPEPPSLGLKPFRAANDFDTIFGTAVVVITNVLHFLSSAIIGLINSSWFVVFGVVAYFARTIRFALDWVLESLREVEWRHLLDHGAVIAALILIGLASQPFAGALISYLQSSHEGWLPSSGQAWKLATISGIIVTLFFGIGALGAVLNPGGTRGLQRRAALYLAGGLLALTAAGVVMYLVSIVAEMPVFSDFGVRIVGFERMGMFSQLMALFVCVVIGYQLIVARPPRRG